MKIIKIYCPTFNYIGIRLLVKQIYSLTARFSDTYEYDLGWICIDGLMYLLIFYFLSN